MLSSRSDRLAIIYVSSAFGIINVSSVAGTLCRLEGALWVGPLLGDLCVTLRKNLGQIFIRLKCSRPLISPGPSLLSDPRNSNIQHSSKHRNSRNSLSNMHGILSVVPQILQYLPIYIRNG